MTSCNPPRQRILRALQAELQKQVIPAYMGEPDGEKGIVVCDDTPFRGVGFRIRRATELLGEEDRDPKFQVILSIENVGEPPGGTPLGCRKRRLGSLVIRVESPERDQWPDSLSGLAELPEGLEPEDAVESALAVADRTVMVFRDEADFGDEHNPLIDMNPEQTDRNEDLGDLEDQAVSVESRYDLLYQDDPITS